MYNFMMKLLTAFSYLTAWLFYRTKLEKYQIGRSDAEAVCNMQYPTATIEISSDGEYCFPVLDGYRAMFARIISGLKPYMKNFRDCDDYARYLSGACSMLYGVNSCFYTTGESADGTGHAFNTILYQDGLNVRAALVEPQTGEIGCKGYKVTRIRG